MRKSIPFILLFLLVFTTFACNNKEEKQQRIQAEQDSIAQARLRQQRLQEQKMDRLAAARADSIAESNKKPVFNPDAAGMSTDGHYAVQVGSWRSKAKAQELAEKWQSRGFKNAFVVKYGNEKTGNVWFRVRLGKFFNNEEARNLQNWLTKNYQTKSWILYID